MSSSPRFELPQRPARPARDGTGIVVVLLLVVVALQVTGLFIWRPVGAARATPDRVWVSADDQKSLALRLEDKNLATAAAEAWTAYLQDARVSPVEAGKVLMRIGKLKQDAGDCEGAIRDYYLAEKLLNNTDPEAGQAITRRVRECFRTLGRYGELTREMGERATATKPDDSPAGQQVVAEIGSDKITRADFDRLVREEIELAVKSQLDLGPEQIEALRQEAQSRLSDPQVAGQYLQQIVLSRVLADAARQQGLDQAPGYRQRVVAMADSMLAATLMHEEISRRATVTPEDVSRFFKANEPRYADPATTKIARIACETEEQAREVIERARAGQAFEELAKAYGSDSATREAGGAVSEPVPREGDGVPGIGRDAELHARIWAAQPGDVLDAPAEHGGQWSVIKVAARNEGRQRTLDEVRDQVEHDTRAARRQEVTQQYVRELFDKAGVKLYPQAFSASAGPPPKTPRSQPS